MKKEKFLMIIFCVMPFLISAQYIPTLKLSSITNKNKQLYIGKRILLVNRDSLSIKFINSTCCKNVRILYYDTIYNKKNKIKKIIEKVRYEDIYTDKIVEVGTELVYSSSYLIKDFIRGRILLNNNQYIYSQDDFKLQLEIKMQNQKEIKEIGGFYKDKNNNLLLYKLSNDDSIDYRKINLLIYCLDYKNIKYVLKSEIFDYPSNINILNLTKISVQENQKIIDSLNFERENRLKLKRELEFKKSKDSLSLLRKEESLKKKKLIIIKYGKYYGNLIYNNKICIGMSKEMLEQSWGYPENINKSYGNWGVHEQWCYGNGTYVYIENGKLTSWQN